MDTKRLSIQSIIGLVVLFILSGFNSSDDKTDANVIPGVYLHSFDRIWTDVFGMSHGTMKVWQCLYIAPDSTFALGQYVGDWKAVHAQGYGKLDVKNDTIFLYYIDDSVIPLSSDEYKSFKPIGYTHKKYGYSLPASIGRSADVNTMFVTDFFMSDPPFRNEVKINPVLQRGMRYTGSTVKQLISVALILKEDDFKDFNHKVRLLRRK